MRRLDVRAVRGYYSLEKLKQFNNITIAKNVAIGDPGLLSKYLIDIAGIEKKYDLGIIPHYVDKENELLANIRVKNSIIIDIEQPHSKIFLKQIAECKNIIASSLHGLIAADSLGIPNVRMILSDKITGGDYKYNDYYSAFGLKEHKIINLSTQIFTEKDVVDIVKNYKIRSEQVEEICRNLISVFPYKNKKV
ncbi:MAG: polysaccharide pyruvyl transferase family protein [Alistipes senegalensis]|nr:polysaccharide pyruvyl transferase family protein [Oxalobacter formigenes]MCM1281103.1 polysaccharide pyruvyl transferase family protein [Alistipes senegalensis]